MATRTLEDLVAHGAGIKTRLISRGGKCAYMGVWSCTVSFVLLAGLTKPFVSPALRPTPAE